VATLLAYFVKTGSLQPVRQSTSYVVGGGCKSIQQLDRKKGHPRERILRLSPIGNVYLATRDQDTVDLGKGSRLVCQRQTVEEQGVFQPVDDDLDDEVERDFEVRVLLNGTTSVVRLDCGWLSLCLRFMVASYCSAPARTLI
jgi:hypothetical protein